jgi:hypothetical protein
MFDITAFGELLIDYTPAGKSPAGMDLFEQNPEEPRPMCWPALQVLAAGRPFSEKSAQTCKDSSFAIP